jgi:hypothetical protein
MAVTTASFRINYPEFADTVRYPDQQLNYWITNAGLLLNTNRWGAVLDLGTELFTAHNIALEARAQSESTNGDVPGTTTGPINSKSVDKISVGFDTGSAVEESGGHYNLTIYGTRLYKLIRLLGAGGLQIGIDGPVPALSSSSAWGYPWFINPNPSM